MLAYLQEGWMLDWLAKAISPGVVMLLLLSSYLTYVAVKVSGRIKSLEVSFAEMRGAMLTKANLGEAIREMEKSLMQWADGRFLPRTECEQITNNHTEAIRDLREEVHGRRKTDH